MVNTLAHWARRLTRLRNTLLQVMGTFWTNTLRRYEATEKMSDRVAKRLGWVWELECMKWDDRVATGAYEIS